MAQPLRGDGFVIPDHRVDGNFYETMWHTLNLAYSAALLAVIRETEARVICEKMGISMPRCETEKFYRQKVLEMIKAQPTVTEKWLAPGELDEDVSSPGAGTGVGSGNNAPRTPAWKPEDTAAEEPPFKTVKEEEPAQEVAQQTASADAAAEDDAPSPSNAVTAPAEAKAVPPKAVPAWWDPRAAQANAVPEGIRSRFAAAASEGSRRNEGAKPRSRSRKAKR